MEATGKFCLNIALIVVIGLLLKVVLLYFSGYDSEDYDVKQLPGILTGLLFLAAFLNSKEHSCRKLEVIMGCMGIVISILYNVLTYFPLVGGHI